MRVYIAVWLQCGVQHQIQIYIQNGSVLYGTETVGEYYDGSVRSWLHEREVTQLLPLVWVGGNIKAATPTVTHNPQLTPR